MIQIRHLNLLSKTNKKTWEINILIIQVKINFIRAREINVKILSNPNNTSKCIKNSVLRNLSINMITKILRIKDCMKAGQMICQ
jgi:hypothetical protein